MAPIYKQLTRLQFMKSKSATKIQHQKIEPEKTPMFSDLEEYGVSTKINQPQVNISNKGVIKFNKPVLALSGLSKEDFCFIVIKYSKTSNAILFNLSPKIQNENSFKINVHSQASISIVKFFRYYNLDLTLYSGTYTPELIDQDWAIFLNKK